MLGFLPALSHPPQMKRASEELPSSALTIQPLQGGHVEGIDGDIWRVLLVLEGVAVVRVMLLDVVIQGRLLHHPS